MILLGISLGRYPVFDSPTNNCADAMKELLRLFPLTDLNKLAIANNKLIGIYRPNPRASNRALVEPHGLWRGRIELLGSFRPEIQRFPDVIKDKLYNLLEQLLAVNPEDRITSASAIDLIQDL